MVTPLCSIPADCGEPEMHPERVELFGYCAECQGPEGLPRGQFWSWCPVCQDDTPHVSNRLPVMVDHDPQNEVDASVDICTVCDHQEVEERDYEAMAAARGWSRA